MHLARRYAAAMPPINGRKAPAQLVGGMRDKTSCIANGTQLNRRVCSESRTHCCGRLQTHRLRVRRRRCAIAIGSRQYIIYGIRDR